MFARIKAKSCVCCVSKEKHEDRTFSVLLLRNNSLLMSTAELCALKMTSHMKGCLTRRIVSVTTASNGFICTRISGKGKLSADPLTPIGNILNTIDKNAVFNSILTVNGFGCLDVFSTNTQEKPVLVDELINRVGGRFEFAFINGGFFAHNIKLLAEGKYKIAEIGKPVGKVKNRSDFLPIPRKWVNDYVPLYNKQNELLLYSAPFLSDKHFFTDSRFKYMDIAGMSISKNAYIIGSLSHADQPNERAAISYDGKHVKFYTLTAIDRKYGLTMKKWGSIVYKDRIAKSFALNLDGGGSINMGIKTKENVKTIAKGSNGKPNRKISNILICKPDEMG